MYVMNGEADTVMDIPHHRQNWFDQVKTRAVAVRGTDKDMFTTVFYLASAIGRRGEPRRRRVAGERISTSG